ncbi:MAG: hypothetical protein U0795_08470 [Pirellulales bacterium]
MDLDRGHSDGKQTILLFAQIIAVISAIGSALAMALLAFQLLADGNPGAFFSMLSAGCTMFLLWALAIVFAHTRSTIAAEASRKGVRQGQLIVSCPNGHAIHCRYGDAGSRFRCVVCGALAEVPSLSQLPSDGTSRGAN